MSDSKTPDHEGRVRRFVRWVDSAQILGAAWLWIARWRPLITAALASVVTWLLTYLESQPASIQFFLSSVAFGVLLALGVVVAKYWRDGRANISSSQVDELGTVERIRARLIELAKGVPVKETARDTVWHFTFRNWAAEIASFLHASLSVVAARDFMKAVESDPTKWAARIYIEGLAARLDGRLLREHQRTNFEEAKVEPARNRISELCKLVPLAAAQGFVAGTAEYKRDWKRDTYRGLSAIVDKGIAKDYSNLLKSDEPNRQAHEFLKSLSQALTYDQLRGPSTGENQ